MKVGFLGLGVMGVPMARNLCQKFLVTVWNRSASKYPFLKEAGASIGETPTDVVEQSDVIFVMLFNAAAITSIFNDDFKRALRGKTFVNTSSVPVEFSIFLDERVREAGGDFLEMPVGGSKIPAEHGQLVGMMAGDVRVAERIKPFVEPLTRSAVYCGPIGSGLKTKYAINTFLVIITVGLSESMSLAHAQGLDLAAFEQVLEACPISSNFSKMKAEKILKEDWSPQASVEDCYNSTQLIGSAAALANVQSPLLQLCENLYKNALEKGLGKEDMISIFKIITKLQA